MLFFARARGRSGIPGRPNCPLRPSRSLLRGYNAFLCRPFTIRLKMRGAVGRVFPANHSVSRTGRRGLLSPFQLSPLTDVFTFLRLLFPRGAGFQSAARTRRAKRLGEHHVSAFVGAVQMRDSAHVSDRRPARRVALELLAGRSLSRSYHVISIRNGTRLRGGKKCDCHSIHPFQTLCCVFSLLLL